MQCTYLGMNAMIDNEKRWKFVLFFCETGMWQHANENRLTYRVQIHPAVDIWILWNQLWIIMNHRPPYWTIGDWTIGIYGKKSWWFFNKNLLFVDAHIPDLVVPSAAKVPAGWETPGCCGVSPSVEPREAVPAGNPRHIMRKFLHEIHGTFDGNIYHLVMTNIAMENPQNKWMFLWENHL